MAWLRTTFWRWVPLAGLATALSVLIYLAVQQVWRHAANDPQVQMARDIALRLERGDPVSAVVPTDQIELRSSLAPFVTIVDDAGAVVASSGRLSGQTRTVPSGVLSFAREHGEERVTWQPELGVRMATVVVHHGGSSPGFVVVGRSLHESETRTAQFGQLVGLAWLVTLVALLVLVAVSEAMLVEPRTPR